MSFFATPASQHAARATVLSVLHHGDQGLSGGQTQDKSRRRKSEKTKRQKNKKFIAFF
jgi:hypothetical protein